ncbi:MAG: 30S ribosomal protein S13 [Thermoplasmata archaeon]|nr:MAG: 30S ribosomal protein S13 [Thermoplasmata archaeon]
MAEENVEFRHIVRIAGTDLDGNRKVPYALAQIKGIGIMTGFAIVRALGIDPDKKIGELPEETIQRISDLLEKFTKTLPPWLANRRKDYKTGEDMHLVSGDLDLAIRADINRLKRIRCYRGIRHEMGLPVRGQRNKSHHRRFRRKLGAVGVTKGKK